ncbi:Hypothetical predicted protein [Octopus vulgaris]|uniref:Uncharacterized protein n=1 Tax=Octopus vulgaris TaxID=6645 RepID=A0AA36B296_OCTVU|nr:Hypothetical predicted protein [Octopus vulgaris]
MIFRNVWGVFILLLFNMVYRSSAKGGSNTTLCTKKHLILRPLKLYFQCGYTMRKDETNKAPTVFYPEIKEEPYDAYILIMVDPDANLDPRLYWLHWLKTEISYDAVKNGIHAEPSDEVAYEGPSPPSGIHRYQFFLYGENLNKLKLPSMRSGRLFDFVKFEKTNSSSSAKCHVE